MKKVILCIYICIALMAQLRAQGIITSANSALSVGSDLNMQPNKAIQVGGVPYLKLPSAGGSNVTLGLGAGATNLSGTQNLFLGAEAGYSNNATANVFVGYRAGYRNTTGTFNTFVGVQAGVKNTSGSSNVMIGTNAGLNNTMGRGNHFLGDNAGANNTSGGYNVYIGINAGSGAGVNGSNNVAIGFEAGRNNQGGETNTFFGYKADAVGTNLVNVSALGANAKVSRSNSLVLGNNANIGIGTSAPSAKLEINSGRENTAGLKLTNLTSRYVPRIGTTKFLTVDTAGNVVLATLALGARLAETTQDIWQRNDGFLQASQHESVIIGSGVSRLPVGYSLYVGQGILTEKVKVAIKNTDDWSDKVFEPAYQLRPLSEVAGFIQTHGHLPGVPSAEEVVKQGVDVGKMDAKLLEKIEELTLYTIQLERIAQQQEKALQAVLQKQAQLERLLKQKSRKGR